MKPFSGELQEELCLGVPRLLRFGLGYTGEH